DLAAAVLARRDDVDLLLAGVELELALADAHGAAGLEEGLADADAVHEGAVRRPQVDEDVGVVLLDDLAVVARDGVVLDDEVVVVHGADADLALVEHALLGARAAHDDAAAAQVEPGRPVAEVVDLGRRDEVGELAGLRPGAVGVGRWRRWG